MSEDIYWTETTLNIRFEGENNVTTFTDDKSHVLTTVGDAKISTAQFRYGFSSGRFDGSGDYLRTPSTTDFVLGTGDFTVEAFVYLLAMPTADNWSGSTWSSHMVIVTLGSPGAADGWGFLLGQTQITFQTNDSRILASAHGLTTGGWHHVAVTRSGSTFRSFVDGVLKQTATDSRTLGTGSNLYIGCETGQGAWFNGYMDDLRITKGVCRYTGTFTPAQIGDRAVTVVVPPVVAQVLPWNPEIAITEKFIWATSHITTWTAEERTQLRERPGYSVEYKIRIRSDADLATLEDFYHVNQNSPVKVPMWSSPAYIENVTAGATLIPLSSVNPVHPIRYFLEVGMDVIVWLSPAVWETHTVTSIDAAGAHIATGLARAYTHCYFLVNLLGFISASSFSKSAGSRKTWAFNFTCGSVYIEEYPFGSGFSTFDLKPLISSDFTVVATQESDTLSSPVGLRVKTPLEGVTRRKWTASFKAAEFTEIANLKRKLAWFRGKARSLKFPFLELTPGATPLSVCLSEDSVSFVHSPRYRCSATVGLEEDKATFGIPFPNGYYLVTSYDWDTPQLDPAFTIYEDPAHKVDGHVTWARKSLTVYVVIESTGNYARDVFWGGRKYMVGTEFTDLSFLDSQRTETNPIGQTGIFKIYSNVLPPRF